jgi:SAM-dependent methyltransferase
MLRQTRASGSTGLPGLVQGRFQDLPFRQVFSAVICPMRTIGHLLTPEDQKAAFMEVSRVLEPGGSFIFDHYNIDMDWARSHDGRPIIMHAGPDTVREDAAVLIWDRYDYDFLGKQLHCTVTIEQVGMGGELHSSRCVEFEFRWFPYEEIRDLAVSTGFAIEECYGDFKGSPFTKEAEHMIWVLRKSASARG